MRNIGARSVALLVLCFAGHAHFASSDVHGSYFVDDYIGIWTKFDGIGALSGGGVYIDERCYTHGYPRAQQYLLVLVLVLVEGHTKKCAQCGQCAPSLPPTCTH